MLSCKEVAARASALVDGELGAWETMQMRLHLALCKGCAEFTRQIRRTHDLTLAALSADRPAEAAADRMGAILTEVRTGKPSDG
jgi:anti-sigma factor RsiW